MPVNLKSVLDQTKIALERQAANKFGQAVEDFTRSTFSPVLGDNASHLTATRDPNRTPPRPPGATFVPSSYAAALAGGTSYRPKLKFLFKVEFVFTPEAIKEFPTVFGGAGANDFTFMVKSVDRPKIDFEYEEDVNMYNFRTKALKRIKHRELTVTFLDDVGNRVINFFRAMMMMQSPITRRQLQREGTTTAPDPNSVLGGSGMTFSKSASALSSNDNAMRSVVNSNVGNVIQAIRVKQMYMDAGASSDFASKEIIYDFINARIVSFDLDDLSHDLSEVSLVTMQFDYDWMEIVDVGSVPVIDGPHYAVAVPGSTAPYDMSVSSSLGGGGGGGSVSPFAGIIGTAASGALRDLTSDAVNRAVQSVAGRGVFGQIIGAQAANAVSGIVGSAAKDIVTGASSVAIGTATDFITSNTVTQRVIGVTKSTANDMGTWFSNLKL